MQTEWCSLTPFVERTSIKSLTTLENLLFCFQVFSKSLFAKWSSLLGQKKKKKKTNLSKKSNITHDKMLKSALIYLLSKQWKICWCLQIAYLGSMKCARVSEKQFSVGSGRVREEVWKRQNGSETSVLYTTETDIFHIWNMLYLSFLHKLCLSLYIYIYIHTHTNTLYIYIYIYIYIYYLRGVCVCYMIVSFLLPKWAYFKFHYTKKSNLLSVVRLRDCVSFSVWSLKALKLWDWKMLLSSFCIFNYIKAVPFDPILKFQTVRIQNAFAWCFIKWQIVSMYKFEHFKFSETYTWYICLGFILWV